MKSIPQDVIDGIIDLLATSDKDNSDTSSAALRACGLVCSSFLFTARRHRFRKLSIKVFDYGAHTTSEQAKKLQDLVDVLRADPFINTPHAVVTQIRSLNLNFHVARSNANLVEPEANQEYSLQAAAIQHILYETYQQQSSIPAQSEVQADPNVISIIATLPCIQHFECSFPDSDDGPWSWSSLDEAIRSAVFTQCRSPTISSLRFEYISDLPTGLLVNCQSLQKLGLLRVEGSSDISGELELLPMDQTATGDPQAQIRHLHAISSSSAFESLLGSPILSRLVSLRISMSQIKEEMLITWRLILSVVNTLESLVLEDIMSLDYSLKHNYKFDLSPCRHLRYLGLTGWMSPLVKPERFPVGMLKLITGIATPTAIETIQIDLKFQMMVQGIENMLFSPWTQFDAAFNSMNFPYLKKVDISFLGLYVSTGQGISQSRSEIQRAAAAAIRQHLQDALHSTFSTKSLNITSNIEVGASNLQQAFSPAYFSTFMQNVST